MLARASGATGPTHLKPSYPRKAVSSTQRPFDSITGGSAILDHPLEPVIGRRVAPTRWRMMTAVNAASVRTPHALSA
jgi:hypothetical protein